VRFVEALTRPAQPIKEGRLLQDEQQGLLKEYFIAGMVM